METLLISQIERCAVSDGTGIRTVVFLQGCPLRCRWCCNPETQSLSPAWMQDETLCLHCGACAAACPGRHLHFLDGRLAAPECCEGCRRCEDVCPAGAIRFSSREMSIEDIVAEVLRDKAFYDATGGGMTLSGGEPFLQEKVLQLLRRAKEAGLNVCAETTAHVKEETLLASAPYVAEYYVDYKHPDAEKLREYTRADLALIEKNIRLLRERGAKITLRTPVIPGFNDTPEILSRAFAFARELGVEDYALLPYHELGGKKYKMLRRPYPMKGLPVLTAEDLAPLRALGESMGLRMAD